MQIGFTGATNSLLASGIYGVVKVVATALFVFFLVESLGRRLSLIISSIGMGTLFFIIAAILKTHPPPTTVPIGFTPPPASKAMAAMLYIYVCFYSMGWGPLPWVYVSDIFPTATRHYGLAVASASQWLFSTYSPFNILFKLLMGGIDFVVSRTTLNIENNLKWKIFVMFATVNIGAMLPFAMYEIISHRARLLKSFAVCCLRRKDAVSKRWISSLAQSARRIETRRLSKRKRVRLISGFIG